MRSRRICPVGARTARLPAPSSRAMVPRRSIGRAIECDRCERPTHLPDPNRRSGLHRRGQLRNRRDVRISCDGTDRRANRGARFYCCTALRHLLPCAHRIAIGGDGGQRACVSAARLGAGRGYRCMRRWEKSDARMPSRIRRSNSCSHPRGARPLGSTHVSFRFGPS